MDYKKLHDTKLMELFQNNVENAFAALYERYWEQICNLLNSMINDRKMAEELAQETFIKVHMSRDNFRGPSFGAWINQIAKNLAIDHIRRQKRSKEVSRYDADGRDRLDVLPDGKPSAQDQMIGRDLINFVEEELNETLINSQNTELDRYIGLLKKRAFILYEQFGYGLSEIYDEISRDAQARGISITYDSLENWLSRRDILRALLFHLLEEHEGAIRERIDMAIPEASLTEQEQIIYVCAREKLSVDELSKKTGISPEEIQIALAGASRKIFDAMFRQVRQVLSRRRQR